MFFKIGLPFFLIPLKFHIYIYTLYILVNCIEPSFFELTTLPKGEIVEMAKYGWVEVKTKDGKVGWVWSKYLAPMENTGAVEPVEQTFRLRLIR